MKFGKVLTYKDINEAEKLEGKKVVASENLYLIEDEEFCLAYAKQYKITLAGARKGLYPFTVSDDKEILFSSDDNKFQFIREVIEDEPEDPRYEPYDLSDPKVRDSLRGRWFKWEGPDGTGEEMVTRFLLSPCTKKWEINGWDGEWFLKHCHWIDDGTPCGRRVDKEMSSPVLTRDGKEDEK